MRNKGSLVRWALTAWLLWLVWQDLQSWKLVLVLTMMTLAIEINAGLNKALITKLATEHIRANKKTPEEK